jgi:hypothetical protein
MTTSLNRLAVLSDQDREALESRLVEFDRSWSEDRLAEEARRLPPPDSAVRLPALVELVKIDLERQWQRGRRPRVEDYLQRYPELGNPDTAPPDLLWTEYQVREQFDTAADLSDFSRRFPRQAAALRQLLAAPPDPGPGRSGMSCQGCPPTRGDGPTLPVGPLPEQFGRYRVVRPLGRGGMGSVYLAHDPQLDRPVALKVPHFGPGDGPDIRERFFREARAAATLAHPNVCPVYDVGEVDGTPYLTMAYVEGQSLAEFRRAHGPLPERQAAAIVRTLAVALQDAHTHGVIHRDLNPANVLLDRREEPVVMDFGLARRVNKDDPRLTHSGAVLGTPAYMPPEQVNGDLDAMGPACDIYSLGVILYELLTGQLPFQGPVLSVLHQILTEEPPRPSVHRPGLDPRLEAVCRKAMARAAADRYESMGAMAEALAGYLEGAPHSAPAPPRHPRWVVRAGAAGAAALLALGVVLAVVTDHGTIRIDLSDPKADVTVAVDGQSVTVGGLGRPLRLWSGEHGLVVSGDGFETVSQSFTVRRGDNPVLRVELQPRVPARPGGAAAARPPEVPPPAAREEGFVPLFNGKDLGGWILNGPDRASWRVSGDELVANAAGPAHEQTWLLTEKSYTDFVLRLRFQLSRHTNSGVALRAVPGEAVAVRKGREARHLELNIQEELASTPPLTGALYWSVNGSVYLPPDRRARLGPLDSWNDMELQLRGSALRVSVNGEEVQQTDFRRFADQPGAFEALRRASGRVGLQSYIGQVRFRDIRIKELKEP